MMKSYVLTLTLTLIWLVAQIVLFQRARPAKKFMIFTGLFLFLPMCYFISYLATPADLYFLPHAYCRASNALGLTNGLILLLLIYFTYSEVFFYIDRPLTLTILIEFLRKPEAFLTLDELKSRFQLESIIHARLENMELNGYLARTGQQFYLTQKGILFAKLFRLIRQIFGVRHYLEVSL